MPERGGTPRDDRHLVHRIGVLDEQSDDGVAGLVMRDAVLLLVGQHPRLPLEAGQHALDRFLEILLVRRRPRRAARRAARTR